MGYWGGPDVSGLEEFDAAVSDLARIQVALANINHASSDWCDFIELRRQLQEQIGAVAAAMNNLPLSPDVDLLGHRLTEALARMRAKLAAHQLDWPAVAIAPSDSRYLESSAGVRAANYAFLKLARQVLATGQDTTFISTQKEEQE